jgi:predicted RNase H-like HicB family nuclease
MEFAVVIEPTSTGFSAYVPDLPGCVAAAETEPEIRELIREAIEFHLEGMQMHGEVIPQPTSRATYVHVSHPASRFAIIIEKGPTSYDAYVPDLDGCVAAAHTEAELTQLISSAIELHLEGLRLDGEPVPEPASQVAHVEVAQPVSVA